jgi:hypothetical protein
LSQALSDTRSVGRKNHYGTRLPTQDRGSDVMPVDQTIRVVNGGLTLFFFPFPQSRSDIRNDVLESPYYFRSPFVRVVANKVEVMNKLPGRIQI